MLDITIIKFYKYLQVVVNGPVPTVEAKGRDFEDTMLLLEIIKENKQQEMRQQRVRRWV